MKKKILALLLALVVGITLVACDTGEEPVEEEEVETVEGEVEETGDLEKVVIGVSPVPHAEILEELQEEFKEVGVEVEIVEFTDYVQPNLALAEGDLDLNYFQHEPYFNDFKEEHDLDLVSLGVVHIEPIGVYSAKYDSLDEVPEGATVFIPNDVTNGGRALLILEEQGLIKLEDPTNLESTELDIVENPKNLKFTALEAVSVAATYEDADLAIINSNYALDVGLNPGKDPLAIEDLESPYANLVAARAEDKDNPVYQKVLEVLYSDTCREFIEKEYDGAVFPSF